MAVADLSGDARRRGPGRGWPRASLVAALALVPPVSLLAYLLVTEQRWWFPVLYDDAYYYLGVARSLARGDGSGFTELTATNGYHPLWLVVLVPIAAVFRDPNHLVVAVLAVQGLIWVGLVRQALRLSDVLGTSRDAAVGALAVLGVLAVVTERLSFIGMESAPLLYLLVLTTGLGLRAYRDDRDGADLRVGLAAALVCLTRLDAIFTVVALALVLARRNHPSRAVLTRRAVALLGPSVTALAAYAVLNLALFGTPSPVSGQAKALGAPFLNPSPVTNFLSAGTVLGRPIGFGIVAGVLVLAAWIVVRRGQSPRAAPLLPLTLAFGAGQVVLTLYLVVGTSYGVLPGYHYNLVMMAFGAGLIVLDAAVTQVGVAARRVCWLLGAGFLVATLGERTLLKPREYRQDITAARYVERHLDDDAVLAMGDRAGMFGFLADHPLLQLEGVVADRDYVHALGRGTAIDRMVDEGVDYYVKVGDDQSDRVVLAGEQCWHFQEPERSRGPSFEVTVCDADLVFSSGDKGRRVRIWRFRPALQAQVQD